MRRKSYDTKRILQTLTQARIQTSKEGIAATNLPPCSRISQDPKRSSQQITPLYNAHRNATKKNTQQHNRFCMRVLRIFYPLVFRLLAAWDPLHCGIVSIIAEKQQQLYSRTLFWLRCKLSYHVPQRCMLILPPPSRTLQDWRAHQPIDNQPDLLRGTHPSPRLTIRTRLTRFQLHIAPLSVLVSCMLCCIVLF